MVEGFNHLPEFQPNALFNYPINQPFTQTQRPTLAPNLDNLVIPTTDKTHTPIDSRGLVDLSSLIEVVQGYVVDDYEWRGEKDSHHNYWYKKLYTEPNLFSQDERYQKLLAKFRMLPLHIIELPREFHDFLHLVTLPVEPPEVEAMRYRIASWDCALFLYQSIVAIHDKKVIPEQEVARRVNNRILYKKFKNIEQAIDMASRIPDVFVFFDRKPFERILGVEYVSQLRPGDVRVAKTSLQSVGSAAKRGSIELHEIDLVAA